MKRIKFYLSNLSYAIFGTLMMYASSAKAVTFSSEDVPTVTPASGVGLIDLAGRIVTWVLIIISIVAVIYLIYGGIQYITAGGDADKASKGRVTITNAIIGIIIILAAFAIYKFAVGVGDN